MLYIFIFSLCVDAMIVLHYYLFVKQNSKNVGVDEMSKYEGISDPDLNMLVARAYFSGHLRLEKSEIFSGLVNVLASNSTIMKSVDFINNPADMWPLIVENGICLTSPTAGRRLKRWSASWDEDGGKWASGGIVCSNENPLRAGAIVFLMMKDAKNEK
jgi:hypothetical protein